MLRYVLKRLLWFIPTLLVILLIGFFIQHLSPTNPVDRFLNVNEENKLSTNSIEKQRQEWSHRLGLDLPLFYFSLQSLSTPDTFYRITDPRQCEVLQTLLNVSGNWNSVQQYYSAVKHLNLKADSLRQIPIFNADSNLRFIAAKSLQLLYETQPDKIANDLGQMQQRTSDSSIAEINTELKKCLVRFDLMQATHIRWKNFVPVIYFHSNNQFQRFLFGDGVYSNGLIRGDFGTSYSSREPVMNIISEHIGWSLFFTLVSVLLSYLISIPIGLRAASKRNSFFDRTSSALLFLLHSLPAFWVATLLLLLFANPEVLAWFPTGGVRPPQGFSSTQNFLQKIGMIIPYLILPLIAYTYGGLAFISRLTRASVVEQLQQDYVRTARAKGLPEKIVVKRHALRNAWLPLITVFVNVFPAVLGGTVVLERIFSIPGMGWVNFNAMLQQDDPVIAGVFIITALLVLVGNLLCDVLYAFADKRIRFN